MSVNARCVKVLDFGETLAEGTPEAIQNNPSVMEAYLGKGAVGGRQSAAVSLSRGAWDNASSLRGAALPTVGLWQHALLVVHVLQAPAALLVASRASGELLQVPSVREDPAPAQRRARLRWALSSVGSRGGANSPDSRSRSIAPLPARVGIRQTTPAPHANANSADFTAHSRPSTSLKKGGFTRMNARSAIRLARGIRRPARRARLNFLFSLASTSGCAVSRPIATSSDPDSRSRNLGRVRRRGADAIPPRHGARKLAGRPARNRPAGSPRDRRSCRCCRASPAPGGPGRRLRPQSICRGIAPGGTEWVACVSTGRTSGSARGTRGWSAARRRNRRGAGRQAFLFEEERRGE